MKTVIVALLLMSGGLAFSQPVEKEVELSPKTFENLMTPSLEQLPSNSPYILPADQRLPGVERIFNNPEFITVEREPQTVNTDVYPMVHRNSYGPNRRIYSYSDLYYSPYR
ncbi:MAG: hypothetical protein JJU02_08780 [Cryomorphaceae bacterium]|nr:hypothetical protein [Cryomorphaceae bacterium]